MKRRVWVALAAAVCLAATACSSGETASSPIVGSSVAASEPTATAAPATATESTARASTIADATTSTTTAPPPEVHLGSDVLVDSEFAAIDGKRVGLISHQNSLVGGVHLGDLLHAAPNVELVALFGPEHGARGDRDAGEYVDDAVDETTGVPVYSLFGPTRQPTPEMLAGVDVLMYDLQDVGTRYYTYISTMGLAMQAAEAAGIEFMVLDRPNPLGGQLGGNWLEDGYESFVGMYAVPDVYGLTAGELAGWIKNGLLPGLTELDLTVVAMTGWDHSMLWEDTGLDWIAPSPAITSPDAALLYPATIYFEALSLSYGRGTDEPFQVVSAPWLDADALVDDMNDRSLPGIGFEATTITPEMLEGMTVEPVYLGDTIPAVRLSVTNGHDLRPTELGLHLMDAVFSQARKAGVDPLARPGWLDQLSGSTRLRRAFNDQLLSVDELLALHEQSRRSMDVDQYRLYD